MVFPGPHLDGKSLHQLFESEGVTMSAGVPTVWLGLLNYMKENRLRFSTLRNVVIGGSACPRAMIRAFRDDFGVQVLHAWGMTEMSRSAPRAPSRPVRRIFQRSAEALQAKQGRAVFGVDLRIVDENGRELPWDGKAFGDLQVRGPWVIKSYFKGEGGDPLEDGWFPPAMSAPSIRRVTSRSPTARRT